MLPSYRMTSIPHSQPINLPPHLPRLPSHTEGRCCELPFLQSHQPPLRTPNTKGRSLAAAASADTPPLPPPPVSAHLPPPPPPPSNQAPTPRPMAWWRRPGGVAVALAVVGLSLHGSFSSSSAASSSKERFVKKTVAKHEIVIFSKSYCPYCKRAKSVFKELNKEPYVIELDQRDDGWDIQDALGKIVGRRSVPQVFIDGKHIGGSDDTVAAYESGSLAKLFEAADTSDDL